MLSLPHWRWSPLPPAASRPCHLRPPLSPQRPEEWLEKSPLDPDSPLCAFATACFASDEGVVLGITEEDLVALGIGQTTLSGYTGIVISVLETLAPGFQLLSRGGFVTE